MLMGSPGSTMAWRPVTTVENKKEEICIFLCVARLNGKYQVGLQSQQSAALKGWSHTKDGCLLSRTAVIMRACQLGICTYVVPSKYMNREGLNKNDRDVVANTVTYYKAEKNIEKIFNK